MARMSVAKKASVTSQTRKSGGPPPFHPVQLATLVETVPAGGRS
jgi:hypothetical protein